MENLSIGNDDDSTTLDMLPDDVFFKIFEYMDFEELCLCSQVSRRWRYLAYSVHIKEITINRHVEQDNLITVFGHPCLTDCTESFKYMNYRASYLDSKVFLELKNNCPNLKKLTLRKCVINFLSIYDLPASLNHLCLWMCVIEPYAIFRKSNSVSGITCLDLSGVNTNFTSEDMHLLLKLKNLQCLYLENCFRINNGGVEWIYDLLPQLQALDLEGTCISNEIVQPILHKASKLKELYLGYTCIDDNAFSNVVLPQTTHLETLCVKHTSITVSLIDKLMSLYNNQVSILNSFKTDSCKKKECNLHLLFEKAEANVDIADYKCCYHYLNHVCPP